MKKQPKRDLTRKLTLSRETVALLTESRLAEARGGVPTVDTREACSITGCTSCISSPAC